MKILVEGASRGIGQQTVKRALEMGYEVRAFSRSASKMALADAKLEKRDGDALNKDDVAAALEGVDAVIQALGVPFNARMITGPVTLFSRATEVLVPEMEAAGVARLIAVTGFGAGDSRKHLPLIQKPGFLMVFGRAYADKGVQERIIKQSGLEWTIARPVVLTDGRLSDYEVETDPKKYKMGFISRANVADFMVRQIEGRDYVRKAPVLRG